MGRTVSRITDAWLRKLTLLRTSVDLALAEADPHEIRLILENMRELLRPYGPGPMEDAAEAEVEELRALVRDLKPRCRYVDRKEAEKVKARIDALAPPSPQNQGTRT